MKSHVAAVQQWLRNVQIKSMINVRSCFFFANLNLLFFCCSPLQNSRNFATMVTSHYTSLYLGHYIHVKIQSVM